MPGPEHFKELQRRFWADEAAVADHLAHYSGATEAVTADVAAKLQGFDGSVLDLCCGHGSLARAMSETGAQVTGLDFSRPMLERAVRNAPDARFKLGDALVLPFPDGSFDAVVSAFGLPHLPEPMAGLREVRRVMRPGGPFIAALWAPPQPNTAFGIGYAAIRAHADRATAVPGPDPFALTIHPMAKEYLRTAGLELKTFNRLTVTLTLREPEELFGTIAAATPSLSFLLRSQPGTRAAELRSAMAAAVGQLPRSGAGYAVAAPVIVLGAIAK